LGFFSLEGGGVFRFHSETSLRLTYTGHIEYKHNVLGLYIIYKFFIKEYGVRYKE